MAYRLGFIGAGNMAGAILCGILRQKIVPAEQISVFDRFPAQAERFSSEGCHPVGTLGELLTHSDLLFWCVKPQNLAELLEEVRAAGGVSGKLNVSIVTGKPAQTYFDVLGPIKLVLVMPNTPMLLGAGCSAVADGFNTTEEEFAFCRRIFEAAGTVGVVPPERLPEMVSVHGSTPAFFYRFVKVITDHMAEKGFDRDMVLRMVASTMLGSAKMLLESGMTPDELIRQVSSPGGTTLAGLAALDEAGLDEALRKGLDAASRRSYELGK